MFEIPVWYWFFGQKYINMWVLRSIVSRWYYWKVLVVHVRTVLLIRIRIKLKFRIRVRSQSDKLDPNPDPHQFEDDKLSREPRK